MDNKIRLLIVEDEAIIAETVKMNLEDIGYEVKGICYTYEDAYKAIEEGGFDILLLDINLGNHDHNTGLDLAEKLLVKKQVPYIFLTAFSDTDTILRSAKLRPSAYLIKPTNTATLFAAIQTAFENFEASKPANLSKPDEELNHFFIKVGSKVKRVLWTEVYGLVAIKNYVKLLTPDNASGYLIRGSLQHVLCKIVPQKFRQNYFLVSRNTMIQKDVVTEFTPTHVVTPFGEFEANKTCAKNIIS